MNEKFRAIPLPDRCFDSHLIHKGIAVLEGCLVVLVTSALKRKSNCCYGFWRTTKIMIMCGSKRLSYWHIQSPIIITVKVIFMFILYVQSTQVRRRSCYIHIADIIGNSSMQPPELHLYNRKNKRYKSVDLVFLNIYVQALQTKEEYETQHTVLWRLRKAEHRICMQSFRFCFAPFSGGLQKQLHLFLIFNCKK